MDGRPGAADGGCLRTERVGSVDFAIWIKTRWCCLWLFFSRLECEHREKRGIVRGGGIQLENFKPKNNNFLRGQVESYFALDLLSRYAAMKIICTYRDVKRVKLIFIIHDIHENQV